MVAWLKSFKRQDWISCVWGTSQDVMTSHVVVAAVLAVWYPNLVKPSLAMLCVHPLLKLVMAMNDKYGSATEILAEGMKNTWTLCIAFEIPRKTEKKDVLTQKCYRSGEIRHHAYACPSIPTSVGNTPRNGDYVYVKGVFYPTKVSTFNEYVAFLDLLKNDQVICQEWDIFRDKFIEAFKWFHNEYLKREMPGPIPPIINGTEIHLMDLYKLIKILDASGSPGLPTLLEGASDTTPKIVISALSFSPDGEHGLIIRWWSLGSMWWEKLSRNLVPVQCTELIFIPPWEGFSPTSTRSSVMASVMGNEKHFSQSFYKGAVLQAETQLYHLYEDISNCEEYNENKDAILRLAESSRTIIEVEAFLGLHCYLKRLWFLLRECFKIGLSALQAAASYWLAFAVKISKYTSVTLIRVYALISTTSAFFVF
uniref:Uncharacterized protein n=1 Tax=Tanacetum cinerariifolium TaxID=118510 RepID=A0A6L2K777_TANCI|nr:hypothetical protein [Tanacetum cinerariifolium]